MENLRNMNRYAYNKVNGNIEPFGTNEVNDNTTESPMENTIGDDTDETILVALSENEPEISIENTKDENVSFEHNKFNNTFINRVHNNIENDKRSYNQFSSSFNR